MGDYKTVQEQVAVWSNYFEMQLQSPVSVAANLVTAILHKGHSDKKVFYYTGMSFEDFYTANSDFIRHFVQVLKKNPAYELNFLVIRQGITDFIERMEFMRMAG
jgi:hypothetical protein